MASKNEHTGELIISKQASKAYGENYARIFGDKKADKRGRFIQCPQTGELISPQEYYQRTECQTRSSLEFPVMHLFKPYKSDVSGKLIDSAQAEKAELQEHNCRIWEGRDQEEREAARWRKEQDDKRKAKILDGIDQVEMDLKYNRIEREQPKPAPTLNVTSEVKT